MDISKIVVNGEEYNIVGSVTTINGKSGAIAASDIAAVLTAADYKLTDTTYSKVSQFTNDSGYITGITKAMVTSALGYTPPTTDTNTWKAANASQEGYVPKSTANKILRADGNGALYWGDDIDTNTHIITSVAGYTGAVTTAQIATALTNAGYKLTDTNTDTNTWRPITNTYTGSDQDTSLSQYGANAMYNAIINSRPTALSSFSNDVGYITGINSLMVISALGYTPVSNDTNTVTTINGKTGAIAAADIASVLTSAGYKLTDTDTNTTYGAGTGLGLSGTTFSVSYGTTAGTACQGNDSRLSNARPASDVYSWAKASSKPSYTPSEVGMYVRYVETEYDDVYLTPSSSITGSANSGKMETVIVRSTSDDVYVYVSTGDAICPNDEDIELELISGTGYYVEVNFLNVNGTIFARGAA